MGKNSTRSAAEMSSALKSLQLRSLIGKTVIGIGFLIAAISVYRNLLPGMIAGIVCALAGVAIHNSAKKRIRQIAGTGILKQVLSEVFENAAYDPAGHLSHGQIEGSGLHFSYDSLSGSDYVRATYRGLHIEMSNVDLISVSSDSDGGSRESHVFRGLWLICDFGRPLNGDVCVRERSKLGKMLSKSGIQTENDVFNKQFRVLSDNEEDALRILTHRMTECILETDEKTKAKTNLGFLREGKLHIALDYGRGAFDIKGSVSDAEKIREQFLNELRTLTDFIDCLGSVDPVYRP